MQEMFFPKTSVKRTCIESWCQAVKGKLCLGVANAKNQSAAFTNLSTIAETGEGR